MAARPARGLPLLQERRAHQRLLDAADRPHRPVLHRVRDRGGGLRRSRGRVRHGGGKSRPARSQDRPLDWSRHRGPRRDRRWVNPLGRVAGHPGLDALGALWRHRPGLSSRLLVLRVHPPGGGRPHGPALGCGDPRAARGNRHGRRVDHRDERSRGTAVAARAATRSLPGGRAPRGSAHRRDRARRGVRAGRARGSLRCLPPCDQHAHARAGATSASMPLSAR